MIKDAKRFWNNVAIIDDDTSCWLWQRGCGSHGYGQFYEERGKPLLTHRYAWEDSFGPIPEAMHVLHRCDNKKCVRPDHLFLGTQLDNMRDMCAKGRHSKHAIRGTQMPTAKLTDDAVRSIRATFVVGTRQAPGNALELAQEHGVTRRLIYMVAARTAWKHVP